MPDALGAGFQFKPPMQPLAALKDDVTVVSGLRIPIGGAGRAAGRVSQEQHQPAAVGHAAGGHRPQLPRPHLRPDRGQRRRLPGQDQGPVPVVPGPGRGLPGRRQRRASSPGGRKGTKNDPTVSPGAGVQQPVRRPVDPRRPAAAAMVDPGRGGRRRAPAARGDERPGSGARQADALQAAPGPARPAAAGAALRGDPRAGEAAGAIPGDRPMPGTTPAGRRLQHAGEAGRRSRRGDRRRRRGRARWATPARRSAPR